MALRQADIKLARRPLGAALDETLVRELERVAAHVLALDFSKALPPGTRGSMIRFWTLSTELDRRGLPASVAVERCRFAFPPL